MAGEIISNNTEYVNSISMTQQKSDQIRLLRARYRIYRNVKTIQGISVLFSLFLPFFSMALVSYLPTSKAYFALSAVVFMLVNTGFLNQIQKDNLKRGAKLQEEFDVNVLGLKWNGFVAGTKVDHEDIHHASSSLLSAKKESKLVSWYEPCVSEVPLRFGRLICQRTNITYDSRLRRLYANRLLTITIVSMFMLMAYGISQNLTLAELLLTVIVPAMPSIDWASKEFHKQKDTTIALNSLKSEIEKLWNRALDGGSPNELENGSRQLQDAIYQHRASNMPIFDWFYELHRDANENAAHHAAQEFVKEVKARITTDNIQ